MMLNHVVWRRRLVGSLGNIERHAIFALVIKTSIVFAYLISLFKDAEQQPLGDSWPIRTRCCRTGVYETCCRPPLRLCSGAAVN